VANYQVLAPDVVAELVMVVVAAERVATAVPV